MTAAAEAVDIDTSGPLAASAVVAAQELHYTLKLTHRAGPPGKRTILAFWVPRNPRATGSCR